MSSFVEFPDEEPARPKKASYDSYVEQHEQVLSDSGTIPEAPESPVVEKKLAGKSKWKNNRIWPAVFSIVGLFTFFVLAQLWMKDATLRGFVVTGNNIIKTSEVTDKLKNLLGKRLEDIKLSDVEKEISKLNYAGKVVATKEMPGNIRIKIYERRPIALVEINGEIKFLSEDRMLLNYEPKVLDRQRLPMLTGFKAVHTKKNGMSYLDSTEVSGAISLLAATERSEFAHFILGEINVSDPKKLYARTSDADAKFIFGDNGNFDQKLDNMEVFWKQVITKRGVGVFDYVDLRFDGKIFAR
ncbi:hypothetical protein Ctha_0837 [Chloroherpeton thalassium ATCC 35110]|uniref:POTRA domain-containing protein n=1 Tax=Chloroherpeton thalassium (strain ATCC 35110 / GB-78) TaxID=517418 RepID=B3QWU1_CHLT3|nr:FtsQ-type POTRA domain-containing protein [Chloroherpeton thalassium]ACF13305.1 hypothetical protein Ctha_0837 [Chloroherpeton thalassium ATCC 35110]